MRKLELLAPAKNLETGIAAIEHGADAVYIGADRFGARQAAGNSVDDIHQLCNYAHQYGATVHVTVNTIVYNDELADTKQLIRQLVEIGVDALLIQDMGILEYCVDLRKEYEGKHFPEIHSSTQCDSRTAEKVAWLHKLGCDRVVLARELSIDEIADIHVKNPDVDLEAFIHGALCVSYSGICYASQYCFGRSANRGECAQFCRMKFDLVDSKGSEIEHQRHLLSLKDMCQIEHLEELADAGACAFKIEGRLKGGDYVKNVVSAYSQRLNELIAKRPHDYQRASYGNVAYTFTPNLKKTFNRGYTTYFLRGRLPDIASFDTPKALGEYVGKVKEIRRDSFNVAGTASFANGDGLCFFNDNHELEGFRINRAVGNRLFPLKMPANLKPGVGLYRNNDVEFSKTLAGKSAHRTIPVVLTFAATPDGFSLYMRLADGSQQLSSAVVFEHQEAKRPQHDNIIKQLSKLGNTIYECVRIDIADGADSYFIPSSVLSQLRQQLTSQCFDFTAQRRNAVPRAENFTVQAWQPEYKAYPYLYNISNDAAHSFYDKAQLRTIKPAFELSPISNPLIMQCRHCIRYSLGYCVKRGGKRPTWSEPLSIILGDGRRFRLEFKCSECQMNIYAE